MSFLIIVVLLLLNFGISWFNAWSVGRSWADSKAIGGWVRLLTWCGATMSACGFTWCYLVIAAVVAGAFGKLSPDYVQGALELGYVVLIFPILGSGLAIWIDSITTAWRRRDLASIGIAAWNTFAQVHNTYEAATQLPGILKHLGSLFKGKSDVRTKAVILMIFLVVLSLSAGVITTVLIVHFTAKSYARAVRKEMAVHAEAA